MTTPKPSPLPKPEDRSAASSLLDFRPRPLSATQFRRLASRVTAICGIDLPDPKRAMVEARLQRRLRALNLASFDDYLLALESGSLPGEEVDLVESITTHTTSFFREPQQFATLEAMARRHGKVRPLDVWSAACSSGMECYTLAMVLAELVSAGSLSTFRILASDVSRRVLAEAQRATYPAEAADTVPPGLRTRYLLRSKSGSRIRVTDAIRRAVSFAQVNLTDDTFAVPGQFDAIFCRNVLIYFDQDLQRQVVSKLLGHLRPDGLLFLGHAETGATRGLPVDTLGHAVFRPRATRRQAV